MSITTSQVLRESTPPPQPEIGFGRWRQPDLIGLLAGPDEKPVETARGGHTLIDLSGGKISFHPAQQVQLSGFTPEWRKVVDCYPFTYTLTFRKRRGDATGDWIRANAELLRFRIADVLFSISAIDGDVFTATGWRVRT